MADQIRDYLINVNTKGAKEAATQMGEISRQSALAEAAQDKLRKGTSAMGKNATANFAKVSQGMGGLVHVYATVAANVFALTAAFEVLRRAADVEIMINSAEQLSDSIGVNYARVAQDIKNVSGSAISMQEALRQASIGLSSGLSGDQVEQIAEIATKAANALGRSVPEAIQRMTQAVVKNEPELVDEYGIILRVDSALKDYAQRLGVAKSELTSFDKQMAIHAQLVKQGTEKFGDVEVQVNAYNQLGAAFSELGISLLEFINKGLSPMVKYLSENRSILTAIVALFAKGIFKKAFPEMDNYVEKLNNVKNSLQDIKNTKELRLGDLTAFSDQRIQVDARKLFDAKGMKGIADETSAIFKKMNFEEIVNLKPKLKESILAGIKEGSLQGVNYLKYVNKEALNSIRELSSLSDHADDKIRLAAKRELLNTYNLTNNEAKKLLINEELLTKKIQAQNLESKATEGIYTRQLRTLQQQTIQMQYQNDLAKATRKSAFAVGLGQGGFGGFAEAERLNAQNKDLSTTNKAINKVAGLAGNALGLVSRIGGAILGWGTALFIAYQIAMPLADAFGWSSKEIRDARDALDDFSIEMEKLRTTSLKLSLVDEFEDLEASLKNSNALLANYREQISLVQNNLKNLATASEVTTLDHMWSYTTKGAEALVQTLLGVPGAIAGFVDEDYKINFAVEADEKVNTLLAQYKTEFESIFIQQGLDIPTEGIDALIEKQKAIIAKEKEIIALNKESLEIDRDTKEGQKALQDLLPQKLQLQKELTEATKEFNNLQDSVFEKATKISRAEEIRLEQLKQAKEALEELKKLEIDRGEEFKKQSPYYKDVELLDKVILSLDKAKTKQKELNNEIAAGSALRSSAAGKALSNDGKAIQQQQQLLDLYSQEYGFKTNDEAEAFLRKERDYKDRINKETEQSKLAQIAIENALKRVQEDINNGSVSAYAEKEKLQTALNNLILFGLDTQIGLVNLQKEAAENGGEAAKATLDRLLSQLSILQSKRDTSTTEADIKSEQDAQNKLNTVLKNQLNIVNERKNLLSSELQLLESKYKFTNDITMLEDIRSKKLEISNASIKVYQQEINELKATGIKTLGSQEAVTNKIADLNTKISLELYKQNTELSTAVLKAQQYAEALKIEGFGLDEEAKRLEVALAKLNVIANAPRAGFDVKLFAEQQKMQQTELVHTNKIKKINHQIATLRNESIADVSKALENQSKINQLQQDIELEKLDLVQKRLESEEAVFELYKQNTKAVDIFENPGEFSKILGENFKRISEDFNNGLMNAVDRVSDSMLRIMDTATDTLVDAVFAGENVGKAVLDAVTKVSQDIASEITKDIFRKWSRELLTKITGEKPVEFQQLAALQQLVGYAAKEAGDIVAKPDQEQTGMFGFLEKSFTNITDKIKSFFGFEKPEVPEVTPNILNTITDKQPVEFTSAIDNLKSNDNVNNAIIEKALGSNKSEIMTGNKIAQAIASGDKSIEELKLNYLSQIAANTAAIGKMNQLAPEFAIPETAGIDAGKLGGAYDTLLDATNNSSKNMISNALNISDDQIFTIKDTSNMLDRSILFGNDINQRGFSSLAQIYQQGQIANAVSGGSSGGGLFSGLMGGIGDMFSGAVSWFSNLWPFAEGGITNSLQRYATGGITNGPEVALIGDNNSGREAIVPLPSGESIPVEFTGEGGEGGTTTINININVTGGDNPEAMRRSAGQVALAAGQATQRALQRNG